MTFGEDWGWGAAKDEARKVYEAFREAGGNFIDTANVYTNGSSERFVGESRSIGRALFWRPNTVTRCPEAIRTRRATIART